MPSRAGAPVLRDALAVFDCKVDEMMVAHSHAVIIGEFKAVLLVCDIEKAQEARLFAAGAVGLSQPLRPPSATGTIVCPRSCFVGNKRHHCHFGGDTFAVF
jgi:flavin reductase (DIM6/NTAB) family NADH-FMN oxidoreductase RutF